MSLTTNFNTIEFYNSLALQRWLEHGVFYG